MSENSIFLMHMNSEQGSKGQREMLRLGQLLAPSRDESSCSRIANFYLRKYVPTHLTHPQAHLHARTVVLHFLLIEFVFQLFSLNIQQTCPLVLSLYYTYVKRKGILSHLCQCFEGKPHSGEHCGGAVVIKMREPQIQCDSQEN